jgi:hypothetical protein
MTLLRQLAKNTSGVYGSTPAPETLPGKAALKAGRMAKAVELLIVDPQPNVTVLAEKLGVSRATFYRMLADPLFQVMLQKALSGRISMVATRALDAIEKTLDTGSPSLRFKAAAWLLERIDKLRAASGAPTQKELDKAVVRARAEELLARMRASRFGEDITGRLESHEDDRTETGLEGAARALLDDERRTEDELADAELDAEGLGKRSV